MRFLLLLGLLLNTSHIYAITCIDLTDEKTWQGPAHKELTQHREKFFALLTECKNNTDIEGAIKHSFNEYGSKLSESEREEIFQSNKASIKFLAELGLPRFQFLYAWLHNNYDYYVVQHQPTDYYTYIYWLKKAASQRNPDALFELAQLSKGFYLTRYTSAAERVFYPFFTLTPQQSLSLLKGLIFPNDKSEFHSQYEVDDLIRDLEYSASQNPDAANKPVDFSNDNEPYQETIWLKGNMGKTTEITMILHETSPKKYEGYYFYDNAYQKWRSKLPLVAEARGSILDVKVGGPKQENIETFELTIKSTENGRIYYTQGTWRNKEKSLPVELGNIELFDDNITCKEMSLAPDFVFNRNIDFGSGLNDNKTSVETACPKSPDGISLMVKALSFAKDIRLDAPFGAGCGGSITAMQWRMVNYQLAMAGYAPDIYLSRYGSKKISNQKNLENWSKIDYYNKTASQRFTAELNRIKPMIKQQALAGGGSEIDSTQLSEAITQSLLDMAVGGGTVPEYSKPLLITNYETQGIAAVATDTVPTFFQDALNYALLNAYPEELIKALIKKNETLNYGNESPIFYSLSNVEMLKVLLKSGADINYGNEFGKTVLFYAIQNNDLALTKFLLDNGADANHKYKLAKDYEGKDSMYAFCIQKKGRTPLMHAAQHASLEIIKYLLSKGANPDEKDEQGNTVSDYAINSKFQNVKDFFEQNKNNH